MWKIHKKKLTIRGVSRETIDTIRSFRIKYGLRNQSEYARAAFLVRKYRMVSKLDKQTIANVLKKLLRLGALKQNQSLFDLKVENFLDIRLQTVVSKKYGISMRHARKLITTGRVKVNEQIIKYPSYMPRLEKIKFITIIKNAVVTKNE